MDLNAIREEAGIVDQIPGLFAPMPQINPTWRQILPNWLGLADRPTALYFLPGTIASLAALATRIFTTVLWKNSDFFQEPEQRYEDLLELGES